jgi:diadenosine tetraphosphate (Ap4A) HIT family hydrolase
MMNTFPHPGECPMCRRASLFLRENDPGFIYEFEHSVLVLGDHDYHHGYSVLILKDHVRELHEIAGVVQTAYVEEMMRATRAMAAVLRPWKMNHACLGNRDAHVHWHLIPRHQTDPDHLTQPWLRAAKFNDHQLTEDMKTALAAEIRAAISIS